MFKGGYLIFALSFAIVFILSICYAYRKDSAVNRRHFPKSYRLLIAILLIFSGLFFLIKLKNYLFNQ